MRALMQVIFFIAFFLFLAVGGWALLLIWALLSRLFAADSYGSTSYSSSDSYTDRGMGGAMGGGGCGSGGCGHGCH